MKLNGYKQANCHLRSLAKLVLLATLAGCSAPEPTVELPDTALLHDQQAYALIVVPLARLFAAPEYDSGVVGHVYADSIVNVAARTADQRWVAVHTADSSGWVDARFVELYARRGTAQDAVTIRNIDAP